MAKKERTKSARVKLTAAAYKIIEAAAFKNCRDVSQELSYRIESQISGKAVPAHALDYDAPATARYDEAPAPVEDILGAPLPPAGWTPEQETDIQALGSEAKMSEAQITALRLIHKHYDAVKAAIKSEKVLA